MDNGHAMAAIMKDRKNVEDFVHSYYSKEMYLRAHGSMIHPILDHSMWTIIPGDPLDPPPLRRSAGRPRKARKRAADEPAAGTSQSKRSQTVKCMRCKEFRHNKRTCQGGPVRGRGGPSKRGRGNNGRGSASGNEVGETHTINIGNGSGTARGIKRGRGSRGRGTSRGRGRNTTTTPQWEISGIPCKHAMAAIMKDRKNVEDFVHSYYSKEMYLRAHGSMIHPILDHSMWTIIPGDPLDPPPLRRSAGRPRKARKRAADEPAAGTSQSKRSQTVKCMRCKEFRHNKRTCQGGPVRGRGGPSKRGRGNNGRGSASGNEVGETHTINIGNGSGTARGIKRGRGSRGRGTSRGRGRNTTTTPQYIFLYLLVEAEETMVS
ncbi:hypothetical protein RHGRI_001108 [Rhododendron griersonianum]|uniref:SWIM-type domain-containing protein n=1 Tax=Rhododendron griersonianum TaxID=479676 RepID=A0AAV6LJB5_9ERIC|nr:hypothetical protein RHGRI_001108 [Rhododendron griersonianum]